MRKHGSAAMEQDGKNRRSRRSQIPVGLVVLALLSAPVFLLVLFLGFLPRWHQPHGRGNPTTAPLAFRNLRPSEFGEVLGRVTTADGESAPRVAVTLLGPGPAFLALRELTTDDLGAFYFGGVPPGPVRVNAHDAIRGSTTSAEVVVAAGGRVASLLLALVPDQLVTGRVLDLAGEPVASAYVTPEGFPWVRLRAEVDKAGFFTLSQVPRFVDRLRASAPGFVSEVVSFAPDVPPGQSVVVTLRLHRAPPLEGVVLDPADRPVPGATVTACDEKPERWEAQAGADGVFQIPAAAAGCPLIAAHPRYASSRSVTAESGSRVLLRLSPGGTLTGTVVDASGTSLPAFFVGVEAFFPAVGTPRGRAQDAKNLVNRVTDAQGAFSFDPLAPGTYVLVARAEGYAPALSASVEVRSGERTEGVRIPLSRGATLQGRLVDPVRGAPLAGVSVALDGVATSLPAAGATVKTDANGYFQVTGVPATSPVSLRLETLEGGTTLMTGLQVSLLSNGVLPTYALASLARTRVRYDGIGARLAQMGTDIVVLEVKNDGPADREGLRRGDVVRAIDEVSVGRLPLSDIVQKLRGRPGSEVEVRVRREGSFGEREFLITREQIEDDAAVGDLPA